METPKTDREKVTLFLESIGETDTAQISEVMEMCKTNPEYRAYMVERYNQDCKK